MSAAVASLPARRGPAASPAPPPRRRRAEPRRSSGHVARATRGGRRRAARSLRADAAMPTGGSRSPGLSKLRLVQGCWRDESWAVPAPEVPQGRRLVAGARIYPKERGFPVSSVTVRRVVTTVTIPASMHDHAHVGPRPEDRAAQRPGAPASPFVLTATFTVAEVVGGLLTGSLALLADAGHMLSDSFSLAVALFAIWIASARRPHNAASATSAPRSWPHCSTASRLIVVAASSSGERSAGSPTPRGARRTDAGGRARQASPSTSRRCRDPLRLRRRA